MWHTPQPFLQPGLPPHHQQQFQQYQQHHLNGASTSSSTTNALLDQHQHHHHQPQTHFSIKTESALEGNTSVVDDAQRYQQQQQQQHTASIMDVVAAHSSNPRASRNMAEKQRRDNLNTQIQTMASLVPTVTNGGSRKKDKISVLRLTAAHLRIAYTLGLNSNDTFLPRRFNDIDLENCLIDNLAGNSSFLLVLTTTGKIIYISRHVEQHLGHEQIDLIGDSLYNYVYQDDHNELARNLQPDESLKSLTNHDQNEENSINSEDSSYSTNFFKDQRKNFNIRMSQRTNSRRDAVHYEYLQINGVLRLANEVRNENSNSSRFKHKENSSNDIIFVGTARLLKNRTVAELSLLEANKTEYFTRHLVDGRIIFCDHRISVIAGYMSEEVSGTSAFKFMHKDDVRWTIIALRHMYDRGRSYGCSCYRLLTKTGGFIYLRTHGYLEIDEATQSAGSLICLNTLTSKEEGEALIEEMKQRFSATVSSTVKAIRGADDSESSNGAHSPLSSNENVEDISQLEDAITHLISDLPSPSIEDRSSPEPPENPQYAKAAAYSSQLPPASLHARRIGIKDIETGLPVVSKGKLIKKAHEEPKSQKRNGEREKPIAEKKIPELDGPITSPNNSQTSQTFEKSVSQKTSEFDNYCDSAILRQAITSELPEKKRGRKKNSAPYPGQQIASKIYESQANIDCISQQNLKRQANEVEGLVNNSKNKKRATENDCINFELIGIGDNLYQNNGSDISNFIKVQPFTLESSLDIQDAFQMTNDLSISAAADQFLNFQDLSTDPLLATDIDSADLDFSNLPPLVLDYDGSQSDIFQQPAVDEGIAVIDNSLSHARLQMQESVLSCESHFNDQDENGLKSRSETFIQEKPDEKKQKVKKLQSSRHKMPIKVKPNIGV